LEELPLSEWVATSDWGYPIMLSIHSIGMAAVVGLVLMLDIRVLGYATRIPVMTFRKFMPYAWIGFVLNLISGLLLFASTATRLISNWPFILKMISIVLGGVMTFWLWRALESNRPSDSAEPNISRSAKWVAFGSLALWIAAIVFGRLIAYILDHAILNDGA
jgi:mannose/fructose/N-acetylgalactosamine-specific phosphotransferase system component IIC